MVVALLAGFGPGLVATAAAGFIAAYWILPPIGLSTVVSPVNRLGLVIFTSMGLFISAVAELYRRNRDKAAAFDRELALRESREILRRQAELIDPVRAEIIAREMQRVVRDRGAAGVQSAHPTDETLRHAPAAAGAVVAGIGLLVLVGWLFGSEPLKSVLPGLANMKANTALCFVLAGLALAGRDRLALRLVCTGLACAVAGLTLAEYVAQGSFGLDQLLFRDTLDAHTINPGRMAESTALGLLLGCASLLLLTARGRIALWAQQSLAVGMALIGMVAVLGYACNVQQFYNFAGFASMAMHTAAAFVILAAGLLFARSDGLGAVLLTPGPGAQLMRRLLPAAVLAPALLAWLIDRWLKPSFFSEGMDTAALALAMTVSLVAMVWWTALAINRADAARRVTETQLRNMAEVMDNAYEPLIVREPGGVILAWNRGAEALYGWPAAEALGQREQSLLHTEGHSVEEIEHHLQTIGHWEGELSHIARDGRRVTVESRQTASRIGDDRIFILESNRDITERQRAQEVRRESEERLRFALETIHTGAWDLDLVGHTAFRSLEHDRIFGYADSLPEWTYEMFLQHVLPEDRAMVDGRFRHAMESRTDWNFECRIRRADGQVRWIWAAGRHHGDATGVRHRMAGIVQDITARKEAEQALRESEARFRLLAETMWQGVVHQDADGTIVVMNPAAQRILGKSQDQFLGSTSVREERDTIREDGSLFPGLEHPAMVALRTGQPVRGVVMGVFNPTLAAYRWISIDAVPVVRPGQNRPSEVYTVFEDITERKRNEEHIRASLAEKEVLLKEIHHRVKNNMQVISSLMALQAERLPDAAMREVLQDVTHRVRSMALVHEKLYQSADMARVEFAEYAESLLNYLWRAHANSASGVRLALDMEPVPLSINAAVPCGLVLNELVGNALKHAFRNGGGRRGDAVVGDEVAVSLRGSSEGRVCLRVRDNGTGLPKGFDWRQTDSLGLRLVHMLAGQLHATVEVSSNEGTEFTVTFGGPTTLGNEKP